MPIVTAASRDNQLQGGQLDLMHTSNAQSIDKLKKLGPSQVSLLVDKSGTRDVRYYMLNTQKPPFDDLVARQALAYAINREELNQIRNKNLFTVADSVFDKGSPGYIKNNGYPKYNLKKAKALVEQYRSAHGGEFPKVTLLTTTDPENGAEAQLVQEQISKAGINADISQLAQSAQINDALLGELQHPDLAEHPQRRDARGPGELCVVLHGVARELRQVRRPRVPGPARPGPCRDHPRRARRPRTRD